MTDQSNRRRPGTHMHPGLRREHGLVEPATPAWPTHDPDAAESYQQHLQQVLDGLHAMPSRE